MGVIDELRRRSPHALGDLSPAVGLPQALTVLEALLGQIFLVTLVARLVTLWVRQGADDDV